MDNRASLSRGLGAYDSDGSASDSNSLPQCESSDPEGEPLLLQDIDDQNNDVLDSDDIITYVDEQKVRTLPVWFCFCFVLFLPFLCLRVFLLCSKA